MVENFDPTTIEDEGLRQVVITLMNLVETQHTKIQEQAEEMRPFIFGCSQYLYFLLIIQIPVYYDMT